MKVDFHCHTKKIKTGDSGSRNVDAKTFKRVLNAADVKIVAITNHNVFDYDQYKEFKEEVGESILVLPGIELDVMCLDADGNDIEDQRGHVVVACNDTKIDDFMGKVNTFIGSDSPDNFVCPLKDFVNFANSLDCIVMVHHWKKPDLNDPSLAYLEDNLNKENPLFYEPVRWRQACILINHGTKSIYGSDVTDWNDYPGNGKDLPEIKVDLKTFHDLKLFLKRDPEVIETLLKKQQKYDVPLLEDGKDSGEKITIYQGINVIFGGRATGKTTLLDESINTYFTLKGKHIEHYSPSETNVTLKSLLEVKDNEKQLSNYGKDNLKSTFDEILGWSEEDVVQLSNYLNHFKYEHTNSNRQKIKILNITNPPSPNNDIDNSQTDFSNIKDALSKIESINLDRYLTNEEQNSLNELLNNLYNNIFKKYSFDYINHESDVLTNDFIDKIKVIVDKKTNEVSIPSDSGFRKYANNLFELILNIKRVTNSFDFMENKDIETLKIDSNKKVKLRLKAQLLSNKSKKSDGFEQIDDKKKIKKSLLDLEKYYFGQDQLNNELDDLKNAVKDLKHEGGLSLDDFLGVNKTIIDQNENDYILSRGEETLLTLNMSLKDNAESDVYLLDEPETNLSNDFVNDFVVSKLFELERLGKTIVVVTHNANIAIRTLPYCSILKTHDGDNYQTYQGSPYFENMVNISNPNDIKKWKEESIELLEGGEEAFQERGEIYGI